MQYELTDSFIDNFELTIINLVNVMASREHPQKKKKSMTRRIAGNFMLDTAIKSM